jgi:hypothetical protein
MEIVYQAENQSMTWCIDCHRNPEPHFRPVSEVTNLAWTKEMSPDFDPKQHMLQNNIKPQTNCAVCHR